MANVHPRTVLSTPRYFWGVALLLGATWAAAGQEPQPKGDAAGATHRQVGEIRTAGGQAINRFCVAADGTLWTLIGSPQQWGAGPQGAAKATGRVQAFAADGQAGKAWDLDFQGQAITVGPDGDLWIAGAGQVARFSPEGARKAGGESPHVALVMKDPDKLRQEAEENLKAEKEMYAQQVKVFEEQLKRVEAQAKERQGDGKPAPKKEPQDGELVGADFKQMVEAYRQQLIVLEKKPISQVIAEIKAKLTDIHSVAVTDRDVFISTRETKGYGFCVWRLTPDLKEAKKVVGGLSGCCGQMDCQCCDGELYVAENSRHRVCRYDRDGKLLGKFGKSDREGQGAGFGSCCNPMNLAFHQSEVFTSESDGRVKRFTKDGKYLGLVGVAQVQEGCKNSAIGLAPDLKRVYYIDSQKGKILILARADDKAKTTAGN